ncbi:MAG: hypothetical protein LUD01_08660 [Clostridiales bacterium]|nr:hypothetical protein [Clostridiales bacterium]
MGKKRKCRYTDAEMATHEQAVRIRKMTDAQLVEYIEEREAAARKEGIRHGKMMTAPGKMIDIQSLVDEIGSLKGIGAVKLKYIGEILEKRLGGEAE